MGHEKGVTSAIYKRPELTPEEASAEAVAAIACASRHHAAWLWDGVGGRGYARGRSTQGERDRS